MVLRVVDEGDRVADRGVDRVRGEGEPAVADLDLGVGRRRGGGSEDGGESSGGDRETHISGYFFFVDLSVEGRGSLARPA